jgi:hypothetical protein
MTYVQDTFTHGDNDAFRQHMTEVYDDVCKRAYATIIPFNMLALMILDEAVDQIMDKGLYRHMVKKHLSMALAEAEKFKASTHTALTRRKDGLGENRYLLVQNMANELMKRLDPDIFKMRMSVKSFLDKNRQPDTQFRSYVVLADIMLDFSVQLFDEFFNAYHERTHARFHYDFLPARLEAVKNSYHKALNLLFRNSPSLDLNDDPNIVLAYRVINTRLSNGEMLNESGLTAMGYDSEFAKMLEGEDFLDNQEQNKKV